MNTEDVEIRFVHQRVGERKDSTQRAMNATFHACNNYAERSSITASSAPLCMQSIPVHKWPSFALSLHNGLKNQINVGQLKICAATSQ